MACAGRRRRARERAPARSYLESAAQIGASLDAAGDLDRETTADRKHVARRAMLSTLVFAGLRISELCNLRWRDVDLATGWVTIADSKTDAGRGRRVKIRGALRDELTSVRARLKGNADGYVFPTRTNGPTKADNFRNRVLAGAVKRANERLAEDGLSPLPAKVSPHSLRRTFASLLYALGEDPGVVMDELGHSDPKLALRVYRQAMRRDEGDKAALKRLVDGGVLAANGSASANGGPEAPGRTAETPIESGV